MCDTPPDENRKITRFAFAGKCGCFGASGSATASEFPASDFPASAAANSERMPGSSSDPPTSERKHARRERPNCGVGKTEPGVEGMAAAAGDCESIQPR